MKKFLTIDWTSLLPTLKANVFKLSGFTLVFGFIKLNAFTAALLLSNFVADVADYGLFEYALSIGFMIAIPLDFGLNGAYPYFNLKLKRAGFRSVFYFHGILMGLVILGIWSINFFGTTFIPAKYTFAILIGGIVAIQALSSAILKSHEVLFKAVFFDGGLFLALNAYNAWLYVTGNAFDVTVLQLLFGSYLFALTLWQAWAFYQNKADFRLKNYLEVLRFGKNLVLSAFLIICLTGSARLLIEWYLDLESVGYYGFYFRFAAVTVLLHQIVNIVFFKKMYQSDASQLDKYFALFLQLLVLAGLLLWQIIPPLLDSYLTLLQDSFETYRPLYFILTFQMIFWIALALNENIIYRENLSRRMNYAFLLLILLMLGGIWLLNMLAVLDIFWLSIVNLFAIFLATESQFFLLKQRAIFLPKTKWTSRGIFILFCLFYYFIF